MITKSLKNIDFFNHFVFYNSIYCLVPILFIVLFDLVEPLRNVIIALTVVISTAHFVAPTITFYFSPIMNLENNINRKKIHFTLFFILLLSFALIFLGHVFLNNESFYSLLVVLAWLLFLWNNLHFAKQNYGILRTSDSSIIERLTDKIRNLDLTYLLINNMILMPLILIIKIDRLKILSDIKILYTTDKINNFVLGVLFAAFLFYIFTLIFNFYKKTLNTHRFLFLSSIFAQVACMSLLHPLIAILPYAMNHWTVEILTSSKALAFNRKKVFSFKKHMFFTFIIVLVGYLFFKIDSGKNLFLFFLVDIQKITFDETELRKYLQLVALSFGFCLIMTHFYLTRYIYSNKKIRNQLFH